MSSRRELKEQARLERQRQEQEVSGAAASNRRMGIIGGVLGLAVIAVIVAIVVSSGALKSDDIQGSTEVADRFADIPQRGVELGEPDAPAVLVEYADLKCPFCAEFSKDSLPTLITDYVATGKLKIIFRNLTILDGAASGQDSTDAATFAQAAGLQNKLWNFVDLFYINQKDEATQYATDEFLESLGNAIPGLDVQKAMDQRSSKQVSAQLKIADDLSTKNSVAGTPAFFVGPTEAKATEVSVDDLADPSAITSAVDALQP